MSSLPSLPPRIWDIPNPKYSQQITSPLASSNSWTWLLFAKSWLVIIIVLRCVTQSAPSHHFSVARLLAGPAVAPAASQLSWVRSRGAFSTVCFAGGGGCL